MKDKLVPQVDKEWNKHHCAQMVLDALEKETDGMKTQYSLLRALEEGGYTKAAALQREIISDEKNHSLIYQAMLQEFDGNIPISDDGVQGALQTLKKSISKESESEMQEGGEND